MIVTAAWRRGGTRQVIWLWTVLALGLAIGACSADTEIKEEDKIPPPIAQASTLLAADRNGDVWRIDSQTGEIQPFLDVYIPSGPSALNLGVISAMVFDPAANVLYAGTGASTLSACPGCLYSIDMATGVATLLLDISTSLGSFAIPGLARRSDGRLFAANDNLVEVDPTVPTVVASNVISPAVGGGRGLTFGNDGTLYMAGYTTGTTINGIDTTTAASALLGTLSYPNSGGVEPLFPQGSPVINSMTTLPDGSALAIVNDSAWNWYGASVDLATPEAVLLGKLSFELDGIVWLPFVASSALPAPVMNLSVIDGYLSNAVGWDAGFVVNSYKLYWKANGTMSGIPANADGFYAGIPGTNFSDFAAAPGNTYFYMVAAVTAAGEGPPSSEIFHVAVGATVGAEIIPFAPVAAVSPTPVALADDQVSGAVPLGFNFTFFGNVYTQAYISSNGFLSFDAAAPHGCCGGSIIPDIFPPNDYIALAWTDLDPPELGLGESTPGTITYETIGSAPNRKFVLTFDRIGTNALGGIYTGQLVLNEFDSTAEVHTTHANLQDVPAYTQGVENASGTVGYYLPGRATGQDILNNDAVRFHTN
ncbi:MAG: hypothetical protein HY342_11280 [Candidatus Lambdaproteobacteria bacterium]|nr:hypothetical protein [Candidatus Lambdaproteobacteria bacterium]